MYLGYQVVIVPPLSKRYFKHHYVPQFYLRNFASGDKRIHGYNLERSLLFMHASLRDQCCKRNFYGSNELETALGQLETKAALALRPILAEDVLPQYRSAEHKALSEFVALQGLRTWEMVQRFTALGEKMRLQLGQSPSNWEAFNKNPSGPRPPIVSLLRLLPGVARVISAMRMHLVVSPRAPVFVTSDNPILRYNQLYETVRHRGTNGFATEGLQIFLPLSPRHYLVLYDASVYVGPALTRVPGVTQITKEDEGLLNLIQLVSATRNIYFSHAHHMRTIEREIPRARRLRNTDPVRVVEYGEDADLSSLLHAYDVTPNMSLSLSFLKVRASCASKRYGFLNQALRPRSEIYLSPSLFSRRIGEH